MNRIVLFFSLLFLLPGWAAAQAYEPMVVEGAHWRVRHATNSTPIEPGPNFMIGYVAKGDTMIGSILYKKVYRSVLESVNGNFTPPFHITYGPVLVAGIREDTLARKVFSRSFDDDYFVCSGFPDTLLYDFSLTTGDTVDLCIQPELVTILQDTFAFLWGKSRRVLNVGFVMGDRFYIEGVGSSYGLFEALGEAIGQRTQITLVDYCVGSDWDCSILTGLEEKYPKRYGFKAYPNPADDKLTLEFEIPDTWTSARLALYDAQGRQLSESTVSTGSPQHLKYSTEHLPAGLYFFTLKSGDKVLSYQKIIIGH